MKNFLLFFFQRITEHPSDFYSTVERIHLKRGQRQYLRSVLSYTMKIIHRNLKIFTCFVDFTNKESVRER